MKTNNKNIYDTLLCDYKAELKRKTINDATEDLILEYLIY